MKIFKTVLLVCCFSLVFNGNSVFSQSNEKSKNKSVSTRSKDKSTNSNKEEPGDYFPENEFNSPFRYVIIKDDVQFDDDEEKVPVRRFVDVLMEKKAFNEANLIYLFKYLSNYYANPLFLHIEVHTSLMTVETLEESLAMSSHSSRDEFRQFYKIASYSRSNDGSEGFNYDTGKTGKFVSRFVKLPKATKK